MGQGARRRRWISYCVLIAVSFLSFIALKTYIEDTTPTGDRLIKAALGDVVGLGDNSNSTSRSINRSSIILRGELDARIPPRGTAADVRKDDVTAMAAFSRQLVEEPRTASKDGANESLTTKDDQEPSRKHSLTSTALASEISKAIATPVGNGKEVRPSGSPDGVLLSTYGVLSGLSSKELRLEISTTPEPAARGAPLSPTTVPAPAARGAPRSPTTVSYMPEEIEELHKDSSSKMGSKETPNTSPPAADVPEVKSNTEKKLPKLLPATCKCDVLDEHKNKANFVQEVLGNVDPVYNLTADESLSRHHPNLAVALHSRPRRCSLMPHVASIAWAGSYWQVLEAADQRYLLYSAAYDNRPATVPKGGVLRILVLAQRPITKKPSCLLWYASQLQPVVSSVVRAEYVDYQDKKSDHLLPYLLTCTAPLDKGENGTGGPGSPPLGVSLVSSSCDVARNLLKVSGQHTDHSGDHAGYQRPQELSELPEIGVCGPALYYYQDDFSIRLVEWLELLKVLGVSKVFLYVTRVHPNIEKVLLHYEKQGFVHLTHFSYPPPYVDEPLLRRLWTLSQRRQIFSLENIYFTDCLVRNMHRYRFLAHFDPDELPVLLQHQSLPELLHHLLHQEGYKPVPSFKLWWMYFPIGGVNPQSARAVDDIAWNSLQNSLSRDDPNAANFAAAYSFADYSREKQMSLYHNTSITDHDAVARDDAASRVLKPPSSFFTILVHDRGLAPEHKNFKSMMDTSLATAAYSHTVFLCAAGVCPTPSLHVDEALALTGHFNNKCKGQTCTDLQQTVQVPALGKLRPTVVPRVLLTLAELNLQG